MNWKRIALFTLILAVGAALRLRGLGRESFWHDEAWSWWLASLSPAGLMQALRDVDAHPPLFYLMLIPWSRVSDSETWLRLLPAILGIASIPLMERLGRKLAGPAAGLLAMAFLALCPIHVYFSQEVRSYTLLFLEALLLANLVVDLGESPAAWKWVAASVVIASMMYTHYMGAFFLIAMAVFVLFRWNWRWILVLVGAVILFIPWLPTFFDHTFLVKGSFWIPFPTRWIVGYSFLELFISPVPVGGWPAYVWVLPIAILVFAAPWLAKSRRLALWFIPLALPIVGEYLVSLSRPLYYTRTFMYVLIPFWTLAAIAVASLPRLWRAGAAFMILASMLPGLYSVHAVLHKEDWRTCAEIVRRNIKPGEVVVVYPEYLDRNLMYAWRNQKEMSFESLDPVNVSWTLENGQEDFPLLFERVKREKVRGVWLVRRPLEGPFSERVPDELDRLFPRRYRYSSRNTEVIWWSQ